MQSEEDRSSSAVKIWMPMAAVAAAITFVIAFVMRIPQEQTIAASAIAAAIVLVVFYSDHMAETRPSMENRF
jgi:hypothetical protein